MNAPQHLHRSSAMGSTVGHIPANSWASCLCNNVTHVYIARICPVQTLYEVVSVERHGGLVAPETADRYLYPQHTMPAGCWAHPAATSTTRCCLLASRRPGRVNATVELLCSAETIAAYLLIRWKQLLSVASS